MKHHRSRSDFWINVNRNEDNGSINISTSYKYIELINYHFPEFIRYGRWRKSSRGEFYNLWLSSYYISEEDIEDFENWCETIINSCLWIGKNANILDFFDDELDLCVAKDFNFYFTDDKTRVRTEIGEAEYNLKYNLDFIDKHDAEEYYETVMSGILECINYLPVYDKEELLISPMPANIRGRKKIAWIIAENFANAKGIDFLIPNIITSKPQMKELDLESRINVWEDIYDNKGVVLDKEVNGKDIIIIDDLYQSGTSMHEYAKFLKFMGARKVFGVSCVKSVKDRDNC